MDPAAGKNRHRSYATPVHFDSITDDYLMGSDNWSARFPDWNPRWPVYLRAISLPPNCAHRITACPASSAMLAASSVTGALVRLGSRSEELRLSTTSPDYPLKADMRAASADFAFGPG